MEYREFPSSGLRMLRAQLSFMKQGTDRYRNLGDHDGITVTPNLSEFKVKSNNTSVKRTRKTFLTEVDAEIKFALKDGNKFMRALMMMGDDEDVLEQAAEATFSFSWANPVVGDILDTGRKSVTTPVVEGWTLNTHYRLHGANGRFEVIALPADAEDAATFGGTAKSEAILASAGKLYTGFLSTQGIRGALQIETVDEGEPFVVDLWDVEIRPDGDIVLSATDDKETVGSFKGSVYSVSVHPLTGAQLPEKHQLGRITDL